MFRGRSKKNRGGNKVVRAVRTSIGWIIPKSSVEKRDKKAEELQKQESRKDFANEINRKIRNARGLGHRFSSVFRRKSSTIAPAEILKIQRHKENGAGDHHSNGVERSIEDILKLKRQQQQDRVLPPIPGRSSDPGSPAAPARRTSALSIQGQEFVYRDFMPHYVERHSRFEVFSSVLKRANKWIKDNQLRVLSLETLLVPAGNLQGRDPCELDRFVTVEVLRIWYDKNQTLQQSLRESARQLPKTLFTSHYFGKAAKATFLC